MNKSESLTLRELREQNKNTAAEVAEVLGVSKWSVFKYESGEREINIKQVLILAQLFDVSAEEIIKHSLIAVRTSDKIIRRYFKVIT